MTPLSMAQNLEMQVGRHIGGHFMAVVDLAKPAWNWPKDGEPPADNRDFLLALRQGLAGRG